MSERFIINDDKLDMLETQAIEFLAQLMGDAESMDKASNDLRGTMQRNVHRDACILSIAISFKRVADMLDAVLPVIKEQQ